MGGTAIDVNEEEASQDASSEVAEVRDLPIVVANEPEMPPEDCKSSSGEPLSAPGSDSAVEVDQEEIELPVTEQLLPQQISDDVPATPQEVEAVEAPEVIKSISSEEQESPDACAIAFATTTTQLVRFIQLQDFVPCDFNEDGIVDILVFNPRISTGYGFQGIGNGLFEEGPSFDLPFRPVACASIGDPLENNVVLLSKEGSLSVFHPLVSSDPPTGFIDVPLSIRALGDEFAARFAVIDEENLVCEVYELIGSGVLKLGDYSVERAESESDWYATVLGWEADHERVPGLPFSSSKMRISDFNCDGIADLVMSNNRELTVLLSSRNEALVSARKVQIAGNPVSIRIADVDANGLPDILILHESGVLETITVEVNE